MLRTVGRIAGGRRTKWAVVAFWIILAVVFSPLSGKLADATQNRISGWLPDDSPSRQADRILADRFPGGDTANAVLVYEREGGLTDADKQLIAEDAATADAVERVETPIVPFTPRAPQGLVSEDGSIAFSVAPIAATNQHVINNTVEELREQTGGAEGVTQYVTGAPALEHDLNTAFESADFALLAVTGLFVLTLLLLIYRSPVIALVPLITVAVAYTIASGIIKLLADGGMEVSSTATSLLAVLMFGAGTDYCLLLVARYTEELHTREDKHEAIALAVPQAAPAIIASAGTVMAALLVLLLAELSMTATLGPVDAIGIAIVMLASITMLPAMLAIVGRRGFWPSKRGVFDPQAVAVSHEGGSSRWESLGKRVSRRPWFTIGAVVLLFLVLATGLTQYKAEADIIGSFRNDTEGTRGFEALQRGFPPGAVAPATVIVDRKEGAITRQDVASAQQRLGEVPEIGQITPPTNRSRDGRAVAFQVLFEDDPYANPALERTDEMRAALAGLGPDFDSYVGGVSATQLDYREGSQRDLKLLVPLVLLVILLTLIALLRAIIAPLYLIGSVILSFFGILGLSLVVFNVVLDEQEFDPNLPLFAFIFLVALGVDYNIFLMDRVREEAARVGTRRGALRALVATGPVITSAGIILAGTFAALITLPITILLEIGICVALGVLVDTFIVRSMLVPAIITVVGDKSWWPSKLKPPAPPAQKREPQPAQHV